MKNTLSTVIKAQDASEVTLGDLQSQVSSLAQSDTRFNNKPAGSGDGKMSCGIWVCDILTDGETWKAVISACDGKYYEVSITVEDGKVIELCDDATPVSRKTMYVSAKGEGLFYNGEKVTAGAPLGNDNAAKDHVTEDSIHSDAGYRNSKEISTGVKEHNTHVGNTSPIYRAREILDRAKKAGAGDRSRIVENDKEKAHVVIHDQNGTTHHVYVTKKYDEKTKASEVEASKFLEIIRAKAADVVHCRSSAGAPIKSDKVWAMDEEVSFMYMPAGVTTITAGFRDKAVQLTVEVDKDAVDIIQASYEDWQKEFPKLKPFGCIEHKEEDASVLPKRFEWRDGDDGGVYMAAEPTARGVEHVNGKIHRSWSPSFFTDADYSKAKEKNGVLTFPDGVRGSATNPAHITGIAFCVGTLTNKPAFRNIAPVKAKEAAPATPEKLTVDKVLASVGERNNKLETVLNTVRARQFPSTPPVIKENAAQILARLGKTGRPQPA